MQFNPIVERPPVSGVLLISSKGKTMSKREVFWESFAGCGILTAYGALQMCAMCKTPVWPGVGIVLGVGLIGGGILATIFVLTIFAADVADQRRDEGQTLNLTGPVVLDIDAEVVRPKGSDNGRR